MNERIKQIRQYYNMSQEEFGRKIGVTRSAISYLESGRSNLTERMLFTICATFDVRKEWIQTGQGEMFATRTVRQELAEYMGKLFKEDNPEKEKYALVVLKLLVDEWDLLSKNINTIKQILKCIANKPDNIQEP